MDILVVSDTHGRADRLLEVLFRARADVLLFLGDGLRDLDAVDDSALTVRAVRGNCDWFTGENIPEVRLEIFGKYRVFLTHGHRYGVKSSVMHAVAAAAEEDADILLYGHTHVPFEKTFSAGTELLGGKRLKKPLLVVCPGSLGQPPHGAPSFATLTIRENGVLAGFGEL